jgi:hypothetical protein
MPPLSECLELLDGCLGPLISPDQDPSTRLTTGTKLYNLGRTTVVSAQKTISTQGCNSVFPGCDILPPSDAGFSRKCVIVEFRATTAGDAYDEFQSNNKKLAQSGIVVGAFSNGVYGMVFKLEKSRICMDGVQLRALCPKTKRITEACVVALLEKFNGVSHISNISMNGDDPSEVPDYDKMIDWLQGEIDRGDFSLERLIVNAKLNSKLRTPATAWSKVLFQSFSNTTNTFDRPGSLGGCKITLRGVKPFLKKPF